MPTFISELTGSPSIVAIAFAVVVLAIAWIVHRLTAVQTGPPPTERSSPPRSGGRPRPRMAASRYSLRITEVRTTIGVFAPSLVGLCITRRPGGQRCRNASMRGRPTRRLRRVFSLQP